MNLNLFQEPNRFFFEKKYNGKSFYIRSMQNCDIEMIHSWVNMPYAHRFWQMQGSLKELADHYFRQKEENRVSTFILCYELKPIALFEVYQVLSSELSLKFEAGVGDYGLHLLMAPHTELLSLKRVISKISRESLRTILEMLFSFSSVKRVFAEPDIENTHAHRLAESAGFTFIKDIQLQDKKAKLYVVKKKT